ncbi:MAG: methylated-DNA--[protein]-cysteine S-methyltransferase [Mariprofundaceae bacterium]|nr:methylated-DNA--[protein]-cysteine S-methyltransferase [Mariprofundaceae bacterium]
MEYHFLSTLGKIHYAWDGQKCSFIKLQEAPAHTFAHQNPVSTWLAAYFKQEIAPIPALAPAKTVFQQQLRTYLLQLKVGEQKTYAQAAQALNTAPRALGQALAANPIALLLPCHRIVAQHGLGGFAYGKAWKEKLLHFEQTP